MKLSLTIAVLLVAAFLLGVWFYTSGRRTGVMLTNRYLAYGTFISISRVGTLWFLVYTERTHQQSLALLPLILLLYPEGLLLPNNLEWTIGRAVVFSGVLVIGSFLWAGIILTLINAVQLLASGRH